MDRSLCRSGRRVRVWPLPLSSVRRGRLSLRRGGHQRDTDDEIEPTTRSTRPVADTSARRRTRTPASVGVLRHNRPSLAPQQPAAAATSQHSGTTGSNNPYRSESPRVDSRGGGVSDGYGRLASVAFGRPGHDLAWLGSFSRSQTGSLKRVVKDTTRRQAREGRDRGRRSEAGTMGEGGEESSIRIVIAELDQKTMTGGAPQSRGVVCATVLGRCVFPVPQCIWHGPDAYSSRAWAKAL